MFSTFAQPSASPISADETCAGSAALAVLAILQLLMLGALFTRTVPHPPLTIPLFALAPFLSASVSVCVASLMMGADRYRAGSLMALLAAAMAAISFGPHKYFDPAFPQIWPAVITAQFAIVAILYRLLLSLTGRRPASPVNLRKV